MHDACRVMVIKKLGTELTPELQCVAKYLLFIENINVVVEPSVHQELAEKGGLQDVYTYTPDQGRRLGEFIDFVVCLGGDGVLLHTAQLFGENVPPIISFHLGSLGFLSQHRYDSMCESLKSVIYGNTTLESCSITDCASGMGVFVALRMRLTCEITRQGKGFVDETYEVCLSAVVFVCDEVRQLEGDALMTTESAVHALWA
jgi:NAD+ kinase